jgi:hypothetical protein
MLGVNGAVLLVSLVVAARAALQRLGQSPPARQSVAWIALAAALISAAPMDRELRVLQTNGVLLLGFVLALHWMDRRPVWTGLALALASSIKYVPLLALPYLLLRQRWTVAGATVAWVAGLALLPAVSLGWSTNLRYLEMAHGGLSRLIGQTPTSGSAQVHGLADPLNISVTSAAVRLAARWGLPERAGLAMMLVVFTGWAGGLAMIYRRHHVAVFHWPSAAGQRVMPYSRLLLLEWAGVMTAAMAFSPNAEFILAVPLAATLAAVIGLPGLTASSRSPSSSSWPLSRKSTLAGAAVLVVALLFPVAALGRRFTGEWNAAGAACWCLLGVYALLCWSMSAVESARVAGSS